MPYAHLVRPVLLVIDMMNGSFEGWAGGMPAELLGGINEVVRGLRSLGAPVIWVRQEFAEDMHDAFLSMRDRGIKGYARGTKDAELVAGLDVRPTDEVVVKKRYSAFFGTDLDARLARHAPTHLVLAGVNTHACVRTTAIDAYQRDYRVVFAVDAIGSYDRTHHDVSMAYMSQSIGKALGNDALLKLCESACL